MSNHEPFFMPDPELRDAIAAMPVHRVEALHPRWGSCRIHVRGDGQYWLVLRAGGAVLADVLPVAHHADMPIPQWCSRDTYWASRPAVLDAIDRFGPAECDTPLTY